MNIADIVRERSPGTQLNLLETDVVDAPTQEKIAAALRMQEYGPEQHYLLGWSGKTKKPVDGTTYSETVLQRKDTVLYARSNLADPTVGLAALAIGYEFQNKSSATSPLPFVLGTYVGGILWNGLVHDDLIRGFFVSSIASVLYLGIRSAFVNYEKRKNTERFADLMNIAQVTQLSSGQAAAEDILRS